MPKKFKKRWRFLCRDNDGNLVFTFGTPTVYSPCPEIWIVAPEWFWHGKRARADFYHAG